MLLKLIFSDELFNVSVPAVPASWAASPFGGVFGQACSGVPVELPGCHNKDLRFGVASSHVPVPPVAESG